MAELTRAVKLFLDWCASQPSSQNEKIKTLLEESGNYSPSLNKVFDEMGVDGESVKALLEEQYGKLTPQAKKEVARCLLEAKNGIVETDSGTYYYPIADRSNALVDMVDPNDRDIVIQIRHAITGGNYTIAEELMKNSWGSLTLKDRIGLIEWVQNMNYYNQGSGVSKSLGGNMRLAKLKKEVENKAITKEEFACGVVHSAKESAES